VDAHTFTKQAKKVQTNVCQKADCNCFLKQERCAVGGINATKDHSNVRSILQNTKKKLHTAIHNKKVWNADIQFSAPQ
jgi:hypothetical protein